MRRSEWLPGLLSVVLFLGIAGSPFAVRVEGAFLSWAAGFTASRAGGDVLVLDPGGHLESAQATRLAEVLGQARVVGVVPPVVLPEAVRSLKPLYAVPFSPFSALTPALVPDGIVVWGADRVPDDPWRMLPGVLNGAVSPVARLHADGVPSGATAAPADFVAGGPVAVFRVPLLRPYGDDWLPGFALRITAAALASDLSPRRLGPSTFSTELGPLPTDRSYRTYPRWSQAAMPAVTVAEVLKGEVDLTGKVVLLGTTDPERVEPVRLGDGMLRVPAQAEALAVAALLDQALFLTPPWATWLQLGALLTAGLLVAVVIPRLNTGTGLVFVLLCLFVAATAEFGWIVLQTTFVPLLVPAAALVAGSLAVWLKAWYARRLELLQHELGATNRLLADAYRNQGQLDAAFARYRQCRLNEADAEALYVLAVDFERRRQFAKAAAVFEQIAAAAPGFRDIEERLRRNRQADSRLTLGKGSGKTANGTLILEASGLARPTIGRYELEHELGRGAMGLVYLGHDPRIGRTVAIKTVSLADEFEGPELGAVRERFFREAETAGRLDHPNIVTIYDVGEEQDLAYIAMDYLKGESLAAYCRPDGLLPLAEIMTLGIQVAEALDYAHAQGVVHRDIKPANIIYDRSEQTAKVTDFGVASLSDTSKTRTGTVLGSPSYMSPEQVAGQKVDGRSDLFSLGITLFQLLTGELPFKADSLASLMYRIANERHTDLRSLREVPPCVSRLINRSLHKDPARRFQRGNALAEALRRCRQDVGGVAAT